MRIRELDGLRGIAVLGVMSEHYIGWMPIPALRCGWLGVDLFFILSGFLITSILLGLRTQERYFGVFYARRALRIFPPYFLGLIVYFAVALAGRQLGSAQLWLRYIFYYSSLIPSQDPHLTAVPAVLPTVVILGLAVLWSLSVEEIYYTLWAPVVRWTSQGGFTTLLIAMIAVAPVLRWLMHDARNDELFTFYCRMDGLAYGSAVALLIDRRRHAPEAWKKIDTLIDRLCWAVLPATILFWVITEGDRHNPWVTSVGVVLADLSFALLAHALIRRTGGAQWWVRMLRARWLRSVGMVSYSLYLFHFPLRQLAVQIGYRMGLEDRAELAFGLVLGLALSFAVAYGLWYAMESRILRWKDERVPSPAHPAA